MRRIGQQKADRGADVVARVAKVVWWNLRPFEIREPGILVLVAWRVQAHQRRIGWNWLPREGTANPFG